MTTDPSLTLVARADGGHRSHLARMTVADDLHTRLRETIEGLLTTARAATPGPWRCNPAKAWHLPDDLPLRRNGEEFVAAGPTNVPICVAAIGPADHEQSMANARHIVAWDPVTVIRHCERDLRVLERHRAQFFAGDDAERFGADPWCGVCRTKGNWPCRELREMAVAYALATEEVNDTVTLAADMARDRAAGLTPEGDTS